MLKRDQIGLTLPPFQARADASQLRLFAKVVGETDPIYTDEAAARAAGYPTLPLPPTFLFSLELLQPVTDWREQIGLQYARMLHGEQSFTYHRIGLAGETLQFETRIADIYEKKGGALEFVVKETRVTDQAGEAVADLRSVIVHRSA
mgnify:CR=1 FL=1